MIWELIFSRLDDDDNGYYGITIDAVEKKELFFALQLCKEYKLTAIPWHKKSTYETDGPGFYALQEFTSMYSQVKFKLHIFVDMTAKAPIMGLCPQPNLRPMQKSLLVYKSWEICLIHIKI